MNTNNSCKIDVDFVLKRWHKDLLMTKPDKYKDILYMGLSEDGGACVGGLCYYYEAILIYYYYYYDDHLDMQPGNDWVKL